MNGPLRFGIRVRPRSRADRVGGTWGSDRALLVSVQAPAVDGKANSAAVKAVAAAFGVRRAQVSIVSGATNRSKVVAIDGAGPREAERLEALLAD